MYDDLSKEEMQEIKSAVDNVFRGMLPIIIIASAVAGIVVGLVSEIISK